MMKQVVRVDTFIDEGDAIQNPNWEANLHSVLDPFGPIEIQTFPNPLARTFIYDHYPEELDDVWDYLSPIGFSGSIWEHREYTKAELLQAEFLRFGTEVVVDSVPGTLQWQRIPLCPFCGFEETVWQFSELAVKERAEGYQLGMVDWHPEVVSTALADEIRKRGFTGVDLVPVQKEAISQWYGLVSVHTLPPLLVPPTRLMRLPQATPECALDHYWSLPKSEFTYQKEGFVGADFNQSYEIFGEPISSGRVLVVSNRVYRMFLELGVKNLVCEPIRLLS